MLDVQVGLARDNSTRPRSPRARRRPRRIRISARHHLRLDLLAGVLTTAIVLAIFGAIAYAALRRAPSQVTVTQTDGTIGQDMARLRPIVLSRGTTVSASHQTIRVDPSATAQTYWGVGGAVTDSSLYLIHSLPRATQTELLTKLYSRAGLGFSFGTVPIGSSDYSASGQPYTYDDLPAGQTDPDLNNFSVAHDERWDLPVLKQIEQIQPAIRFFAVTWTAPPWMKANDQFDDVDFTGSLLSADYKSFADYLVDFLNAYKAEGINVAAIGTENEPNSPATIPSMYLPIADQESFIANDLEPALKANDLSTQIFGGDVGMPRLDTQTELMKSSAGKDLGGLAWHCYSDPPTQMTAAAKIDPSLTQLVTECAEKLSKAPLQIDVIGSLLNQASGFTAWNLALTPQGTPVEEPNRGCPGCRGLVSIDKQTGTYKLSEEAWVLGQVGHFVKPGAERVETSDEPTYKTESGGAFSLVRGSGLLNVAFRNPDGKLVLIVYNNAQKATTFNVVDGRDHFTATLPKGAMTTFTWGKLPKLKPRTS